MTLAMGRALGETDRRGHGHREQLRHPPLAARPRAPRSGPPSSTPSAASTTGLDTSSEVIGLVVVLLAITALVNVGGQLLLRSRVHAGAERVSTVTGPGWPERQPGRAAPRRHSGRDAELVRGVRARRRGPWPGAGIWRGGCAIGLCVVAVAISLAPLVALVAYTTRRGIHALSVDFLTHVPTPPGIPGGGISNAIVGAVIIVGLAAAMAVPVGIVAALFLVERRGRIAGDGPVRRRRPHRRAVHRHRASSPTPCSSSPSHHFSGLAGSFALAVLMLPDRHPGERGRHAGGAPRPVGGGPGPRGTPVPGGAVRRAARARCPAS